MLHSSVIAFAGLLVPLRFNGSLLGLAWPSARRRGGSCGADAAAPRSAPRSETRDGISRLLRASVPSAHHEWMVPPKKCARTRAGDARHSARPPWQSPTTNTRAKPRHLAAWSKAMHPSPASSCRRRRANRQVVRVTGVRAREISSIGNGKTKLRHRLTVLPAADVSSRLVFGLQVYATHSTMPARIRTPSVDDRPAELL